MAMDYIITKIHYSFSNVSDDARDFLGHMLKAVMGFMHTNKPKLTLDKMEALMVSIISGKEI